MKINKTLIATAVGAAFLAACASNPTIEPSTQRARADLTSLKSDARLAGKAELAVNDAEVAVRNAEGATGSESAAQLGYLAERKVQIARAAANRQANEDDLKALADERDRVQLSARTAEADRAKSRAEIAQYEAQTARDAAERERQAAEQARLAAEQARLAAEQQGMLALQAGQDADRARLEAEELRIQIQELNARETERGLVLTLGDVLFETAKWDLKPGAEANLTKLVRFLHKYPDRNVVIEGHTDSVGGDAYNMNLSQRRAEAVRAYLVTQGIESRRVVSLGKGEGAPVASNNDAGGRQQNRRVEVIIENTDRS